VILRKGEREKGGMGEVVIESRIVKVKADS